MPEMGCYRQAQGPVRAQAGHDGRLDIYLISPVTFGEMVQMAEKARPVLTSNGRIEHIGNI